MSIINMKENEMYLQTGSDTGAPQSPLHPAFVEETLRLSDDKGDDGGGGGTGEPKGGYPREQPLPPQDQKKTDEETCKEESDD